MNKPKRAYITKKAVTYLHDEIVDCPLELAVKTLQDYLKNLTEEGYSNLKIEDDCGDYGAHLSITGDRLENDKEYASRLRKLEAEKKRKAAQRQKRYEKYLKLKKEFEKEV